MAAISASAPGKAILFGEHAVVYRRPAIAVPVNQVQVKTTITAIPRGQPDEIWLEAPEVGLKSRLANLPETYPLAMLISLFKQTYHLSTLPAMRIGIHSSIPVAAGLGSGAAVSVSVIRALSAFIGLALDNSQVSNLAFEIEKRHHGTPSGIDNTVITYARPIFFQRDLPVEFITPGAPFHLVIADTGIKSPTAAAVSGVRQRWQEHPAEYESLFDQIAELTLSARRVIEAGKIRLLGSLMNKNHELLQSIGVSCSELDHLCAEALLAGAWGAKLSGGGQGGNMIALTSSDQARSIADALLHAGAVRTFSTHIAP
jgi:mevalonate kinase